MEYATEKDIDRAKTLNWRGASFDPNGGDLAIGNASKMAKLITDRNKILGRFEAVCNEWSDINIRMPFATKLRELWPSSRYTSAYEAGHNSGKHSLGAPAPYKGNSIEVLMFNIGFERGRNQQ